MFGDVSGLSEVGDVALGAGHILDEKVGTEVEQVARAQADQEVHVVSNGHPLHDAVHEGDEEEDAEGGRGVFYVAPVDAVHVLEEECADHE